MEDKLVFSRLIRGLSRKERLEMLEKIRKIAPMNDLPLKEEYIEDEYDYEKSYQDFSIFEKLIIFFIVLFSSKEKEQIIENLSMDKLARKLEKESPGLISYYNKKYLNRFYLELNKLNDSLIVYRKSLPLIMDSNESDFIAFLVGLYFPEIEEKLIGAIDPDNVSSDFKFESTFQMKRHIEFRIDEILSEIDTDKRKIIYNEIQKLHVLKALSMFNFEKIKSSFEYEDTSNGYTCSFTVIRKQLHNLLDILFSLDSSPTMDTLNAVFMFGYELSNPDGKDDLEKKLKFKMEDANKSFGLIRSFNSEIPLTSILCLVNRNMNFTPAHIGGAEDWYVLFRRFWYKKFDLIMEKYVEEEKRAQLEENASFFLGVSHKVQLSNYKSGLWGEDQNVRFEGAAGFIYAFMTGIFTRDLLKPLKLVLIDGQFYKEQNRLDYNSSYRTITETAPALRLVDSQLSPDGKYLSEIKRIRMESHQNPAIDAEREVFLSVDKEFEKIIVSFNQALGLLIDVVNGIVQGDMGGVYDTLSNLGYIGKGQNKNLISQLKDIRLKLDEARNISYQFYDLEKRLKV